MRKNVSMKTTIPVMAVVLIVLIVLKATGAVSFNSGIRMGFSGNSTFHKYNGSYTSISGTFRHTLSPSKGSDTLHCEITTKSGSLHVEIIQKDDDKVLYDEDITGNKTFDITASGKVKITMTSNGHRGSYLFEY